MSKARLRYDQRPRRVTVDVRVNVKGKAEWGILCKFTEAAYGGNYNDMALRLFDDLHHPGLSLGEALHMAMVYRREGRALIASTDMHA